MLMRVTYFFGHALTRFPIDKEGNIDKIEQGEHKDERRRSKNVG
jgi:hypothetical protein